MWNLKCVAGGVIALLSASGICAETPIKLPFPPGVSARVIQGNHGAFSHNTPPNFFAWDFDLPEGAPVTAAAVGRVVQIKQDSDKGGSGPEYLYDANELLIDHGHGLASRYLHIEKNSVGVRIGQIVHAGDVVARVGATGRVTRPHLHFTLMDYLLNSQPGWFTDFPLHGGVPERDDIATSGPVSTRVDEFPGDSCFPMDVFAENGVILTSPVPCWFFEEGKSYEIRGRVTGPFVRVIGQVRSMEKIADAWGTTVPVDAEGAFRLTLTMQKPANYAPVRPDGYQLCVAGITAEGEAKQIGFHVIAIAPENKLRVKN